MAPIALPAQQLESLTGEAIYESPASEEPAPVYPIPETSAAPITGLDSWPPLSLSIDTLPENQDEALRLAAAELLGGQSHTSSDHQLFTPAAFHVTPQQAAEAISDSTMSPASGPSRRSTLQSEARSLATSRSQSHSSKLPRDDGFAALRQRIQAVRGQDLSADEKAHILRKMMMESYTGPAIPVHRFGSRSPPPISERVRAPKGRRPGSSSATQDEPNLLHASMDGLQITLPQLPNYDLSPSDLEPSFVPEPASVEGEDLGLDMDAESDTPRTLGCVHYRRNVKLQCVDCSKWYPCRFCHDEVEDHPLIRAATRHMLCMFCGTPQPCAAECIHCGERGGSYYCQKCKLWDNDMAKKIYHCDDCGLCRIGEGLGADFFHCQRCGVCMSMKLLNSHRCIERSTDCDCPICGSYMFSSTRTVVFMRCGHSIHYECYYDHMKRSYKCPLCSKSVVNMETQFRNLDRSIAAQPMPSEYIHTTAFVHCNDCSAKTVTPYHWLGLKCTICQSYNTSQIKVNGPDPQPIREVAGPPLPPHPDAPIDVPTAVPGRTADPSRPSSALGILAPDARPGPASPPGLEPAPSPSHHLSSSRGTDPATSPPPLSAPSPQPEVDDVVMLSEDEEWSEDEMDFWGGEISPRSPRSLRSAEGDVASDKPPIEQLDLDYSSSSSSEDEPPGEDDMEGGDGDWEDGLNLPGHR